MAHFGMFCPPTAGHLNPMMALGRALTSRGHHVTMFAIPDIAQRVREEGLDFSVIGTHEYPAGILAAQVRRLARLQGLSAMRFSVEQGRQTAEMLCTRAPDALRKVRPDLLIVDQNEPAAGTVAEHLEIPFVSVVNLPLNREPAVPPPFVSWRFSDTPWAHWRNRLGYRIFDWLLYPVTRQINFFRANWKLPRIRIPDDTFSRLAQISQVIPAFDFPRRGLPPGFHYTGPFLDTGRPDVPFPYDKLDSRPLVYVSFGTLLTNLVHLFHKVADACVGLNVQLVISLGSAGLDASQHSFKGNPIVVPFAPQLELLHRARLMINHGGLNSVQEGLCCGVPMVAVPITNDQPAVAARLEQSGAGRAIPVNTITPAKLRTAIQEILTQPGFLEHAGRLQRSAVAAGGVERAADIVETALRNSETRWLTSPTI
jgi:zeaxanthin glucosyltransferase